MQIKNQAYIHCTFYRILGVNNLKGDHSTAAPFDPTLFLIGQYL